MNTEITVIVSIGCTLMGAVIGYLTFRRNRDKDIVAEAKDNAKTDGVILTDIGYIKAGIDDIKRKQEHQDELYVKLSERVTTIEASAKQAHKRLDKMEGKVYE